MKFTARVPNPYSTVELDETSLVGLPLTLDGEPIGTILSMSIVNADWLDLEAEVDDNDTRAVALLAGRSMRGLTPGGT